MEGTDRAGAHPRIPEEAGGELRIPNERRLAGSRGIGEEAVLRLEHSAAGAAPRVVRADEIVRGEDAADREQGSEEDEIEDEKGGEAVSSHEPRAANREGPERGQDRITNHDSRLAPRREEHT